MATAGRTSTTSYHAIFLSSAIHLWGWGGAGALRSDTRCYVVSVLFHLRIVFGQAEGPIITWEGLGVAAARGLK